MINLVFSLKHRKNLILAVNKSILFFIKKIMNKMDLFNIKKIWYKKISENLY